MDKVKTLAKEGWHPERQAGMNPLKRNKNTSSPSSSAGASRPLTSLKDPSTFGPPPKNVNYYGTTTSSSSPTVSLATKPDNRGLGAPLSSTEITAASKLQQRREEEERAEEEEIERRRANPQPYRVNTSGLDAAGLPPPPRRVVEQAAGAAIGSDGTAAAAGPAVGVALKPKPKLPPRLPPRGAGTASPGAGMTRSQGQQSSTTPPPAEALLNQGAIDRLGAAGISVPALGIGSGGDVGAEAKKPEPSYNTSRAQSNLSHGGGAVSELQSRFARMSASRAGNNDGDAGGTGGAQRKGPPPPPPPKKKPGLGGGSSAAVEAKAGLGLGAGGGAAPPPPVPLASKPR